MPQLNGRVASITGPAADPAGKLGALRLSCDGQVFEFSRDEKRPAK